MKTTPFVRRLLAAGLLLLAGCHGAMERRVTARTALSYSTWCFRAQSDLSPEDFPLLRLAEQEIKFHLTATSTATGAEETEAAFLSTIDGLTLRQFLQLGLDCRIDRLKADEEQYTRNLAQAERVHARAGDRASADYLVAARTEDRTDLTKTEKDLAETRTQLAHVTALP